MEMPCKVANVARRPYEDGHQCERSTGASTEEGLCLQEGETLSFAICEIGTEKCA